MNEQEREIAKFMKEEFEKRGAVIEDISLNIDHLDGMEELKDIPSKYHLDRDIFIEKKRRCAVCGQKQVVHIHHIDSNKKNDNSENLVGLCPNHHMMVHQNDASLIKVGDIILFQIIIKRW